MMMFKKLGMIKLVTKVDTTETIRFVLETQYKIYKSSREKNFVGIDSLIEHTLNIDTPDTSGLA